MQRVDSSWEAADSYFQKANSFLGVSARERKFSKGALLAVCRVSISSGCSAQVLFPAGISLSMGAERGLSSFPGLQFPPLVIFSTFKGHFYVNQLKVEFLWTIRHLCSSSQEDCYSGKKETEIVYLQSSLAKSHLQTVALLFGRKRKPREPGQDADCLKVVQGLRK